MGRAPREQAGQPLQAHLRELQRRLTRAALALLLGVVVAFTFHQQVLQFMLRPAQEFLGSPAAKPIFTEPTEYLGVAMKVSFVVGFALALPLILYEAVMFVAPGLTPRERRYLYTLLPASLLAFLLGATFAHYVLLPPAFEFLLTFGSDVATAMIRIGPLVDMTVRLLLWMGLAFELPVVLFFLAKIGVATPRVLSRFRPYAFILAFTLSAIITPTVDPLNQSLVAVPLILLYEIGVLAARLAALGRQKAAGREDETQ